jgi:hypothetical protein
LVECKMIKVWAYHMSNTVLLLHLVLLLVGVLVLLLPLKTSKAVGSSLIIPNRRFLHNNNRSVSVHIIPNGAKD